MIANRLLLIKRLYQISLLFQCQLYQTSSKIMCASYLSEVLDNVCDSRLIRNKLCYFKDTYVSPNVDDLLLFDKIGSESGVIC